MVGPKKNYTSILLAAVALLGFIAVLFATRWGTGIGPDSVFYLSEARNLLDGHGLRGLTDPTGDVSRGSGFAPTNIHPPLYPALLALGGIIGIDLGIWARWLNAMLFGANILLVGIMLHQSTRRSPLPALLGSLLVLTSADMITIHARAMSDPVFIFLGLLGLTLLAAHLENPKGGQTLLASSIAIGLAFLARYPGIALVVAGATGVLFLGEHAHRRRIADILIFTALSASPMAAWLLRNIHVAGSVTGRHIVFHPITTAHLLGGLLTLSRWLVPKSWAIGTITGIAVALIVAAVIINAFLWRPTNRSQRSSVGMRAAALPPLLGLFIIMYMGVLIATISFMVHQVKAG